MRRAARIISGVFLILLGIIGGFLPIIQGWIFILLGLGLIAPRHPWIRRARAWIRARRRREAR